jgi:DNA polymerase elongation subunit (family B)
MKKYILIQNDGEIEANSFELIGASTKRNDNTKIGFFW